MVLEPGGRALCVYISLFLFCLSLAVYAEPVIVNPVPDDPTAVKKLLRDYYFDAARRGDVEILEVFMLSGYPLNTRDHKGYTALILAAYHGQLPAVERLLEAGVDACAQDQRGNTALMGAIFKGEIQIAQRLLTADCNPDQRNGAGQTAAMYAGLFKRVELIDALAAKGADLHAEDLVGNSATRLVRGEIHNAVPR